MAGAGIVPAPVLLCKGKANMPAESVGQTLLSVTQDVPAEPGQKANAGVDVTAPRLRRDGEQECLSYQTAQQLRASSSAYFPRKESRAEAAHPRLHLRLRNCRVPRP